MQCSSCYFQERSGCIQITNRKITCPNRVIFLHVTLRNVFYFPLSAKVCLAGYISLCVVSAQPLNSAVWPVGFQCWHFLFSVLLQFSTSKITPQYHLNRNSCEIMVKSITKQFLFSGTKIHSGQAPQKEKNL